MSSLYSTPYRCTSTLYVPILKRVQGIYLKVAVVLFTPSLRPRRKIWSKKITKNENANIVHDTGRAIEVNNTIVTFSSPMIVQFVIQVT